jgi:hypothetical protein
VDAIHRAPLRAAWISLLEPYLQVAVPTTTYVVLAGVALIGGALALRLAPTRLLAAGSLLAMSVVAAILLLILGPPGLVAGLIAAWPVLAAGLVLVRRDHLRDPVVARVLLLCAVGAAAILVTVYDDGGSTQWGGRFLHLLVPLLAPVVVLAVVDALAGSNASTRRAMVAAGVAVTLAFSVTAVRADRVLRRSHDRTISETAGYARAHPGRAGRALVVFVPQQLEGTSRIFWRTAPGYDVVLALGGGDLGEVAVRAHEAGYRSVVVLSRWRISFLEAFPSPGLERLGWTPHHVRDVRGTGYQLATFEAKGAP